MKVEEKIKLDNFKEQYSSILGRISIANKELELVFSRIEEVDNHIKLVKSITKEKKKEIEKLIIKDKIIEDKISKESNRLSEIKKEESKITDNLVLERQLLKEEKHNFEIETSLNKKTIGNLNNIKKSLNESIKKLETKSNNIYKDVVDKTKEKFSLMHELNVIEIDIEKKKQTIEKLLKERNKELQEIEKKITVERTKIVKPLESLKEQELVFAKKEKNLFTLIGRFKKYYSKQFPGSEIKL